MEKIIFSRSWSERAFQYCAGCQGNTIKNHTCAHTDPCTPSGCVFWIVRSPHKLPFLSCLSSSPLSELLSLLVLFPLTMLTPLRGILQFRSDTFVKNNKKIKWTPPPPSTHSNLIYWIWKRYTKTNDKLGILVVIWTTSICKTSSAPCSFLLKPKSSKTRFSNSTCPFLFVSGI